MMGKSYAIIKNDDESCSECDQLWKRTWLHWRFCGKSENLIIGEVKMMGLELDQKIT